VGIYVCMHVLEVVVAVVVGGIVVGGDSTHSARFALLGDVRDATALADTTVL